VLQFDGNSVKRRSLWKPGACAWEILAPLVKTRGFGMTPFQR